MPTKNQTIAARPRVARAQRDTTSTVTTSTTTAVAQEEQSVEVGWGSYIGKVRGGNMLVIVVLGVSLYLLTLLLLRTADAPVAAIEAKAIEQTKEHQQLASGIIEHRNLNERDHKALVHTQERIADSLDEQVFYLSKTEAERAQYRIEMPDSLARKLVERGVRAAEDQRNHIRGRR